MNPIPAIGLSLVLGSFLPALGEPPKVGSEPIRHVDRHGIKFAWIPPGKIEFAGNRREALREERGFYMGVYEVTQEDWSRILRESFEAVLLRQEKHRGESVSYHSGRRRPAYCIGPDEAQKFIDRLNELEKQRSEEPRWVYRLPSAKEWEFAARGGKSDEFLDGTILLPRSAVYNYDSSSREERVDFPEKWFSQRNDLPHTNAPCDVGTRSQTNSYGLYDVHGNVDELTATVSPEKITDIPGAHTIPREIREGKLWVTKGGGWTSSMQGCSFSYSGVSGSGVLHHTTGIRLLARPLSKLEGKGT